MHCEFSPASIRFVDYPFSAASVFPAGAVDSAGIDAIDPGADPPEVRLKSGEVLFVAAPQRAALADFACRHALPVKPRLDVWAALLAPWVDTDLDDSDDERALARLVECGITRAEIEELRGQLSPALGAYNFQSGLWDWAQLNLFDALNALTGKLAGDRFKLGEEEFARFYWRAMEVAAQGPELAV